MLKVSSLYVYIRALASARSHGKKWAWSRPEGPRAVLFRTDMKSQSNDKVITCVCKNTFASVYYIKMYQIAKIAIFVTSLHHVNEVGSSLKFAQLVSMSRGTNVENFI